MEAEAVFFVDCDSASSKKTAAISFRSAGLNNKLLALSDLK